MRSYIILLELIFAITFPWSYKIIAKPLNTSEAALPENSSSPSSTFSRKSGATNTGTGIYDSNQEHSSRENTNGPVDMSFEVEVDKNSNIAVRRIKSGKSKIMEVSLEEHNDNNTKAENEDYNLITQPYDNNETLSEMNSLTNSSSFKQFNDTDSIRIKDFEKEVELSGEDLKIQEEWGGNCTVKHWDKCKVVESWFGDYKDDEGLWQYNKVECAKEPVVCMRNGWTVNRCHLLCMGYCNKDMQANYDKYVSHDGVCKM